MFHPFPPDASSEQTDFRIDNRVVLNDSGVGVAFVAPAELQRRSLRIYTGVIDAGVPLRTAASGVEIQRRAIIAPRIVTPAGASNSKLTWLTISSKRFSEPCGPKP